MTEFQNLFSKERLLKGFGQQKKSEPGIVSFLIYNAAFKFLVE